MKLLHICKVFCQAGVEARIAITVHIVVVVDRVLYSILGDGVQKRASLFSLVSEEKSIVATCKQGLLELLEGWGNDGDHVSWELLRSSGGDFGSHEQKSYARRELLQSSCCLLEHFELRLSRPPYTILKLMDDAVSDGQKHEVAEDFLNKTPDHCHTLFGKRVKLRCPTIRDLLEEGPHIARALDQGVDIAIDYSERSHGDIRKDVRSSGPARSFTVSANRHYCHEVAAAHRSRPGAQDPLVPLPSASSSSGQCLALLDAGGLKKQKKVNDRRGASAKMEYYNSQMNAFKSVRAPDRALTDAEMRQVRERGARRGGRGCLQLRRSTGTWFALRALKGEFRLVSLPGLPSLSAHPSPSSHYGRHVGLGLVVVPTSLCHHLPSWMCIVASLLRIVGLWLGTTPTLESLPLFSRGFPREGHI